MFKLGDKVRIKPEWCDQPEEAKTVHTVVNVNEYTKRCYIETPMPEWTGLFKTIQQLVSFDMIEKA